MDLTTRVSLVQNLLTTKEIPASVGARLLDINRTSIYYKGAPISDEELAAAGLANDSDVTVNNDGTVGIDVGDITEEKKTYTLSISSS